MSRIIDNIQQELLGALRQTLQVSKRADFCIGYLNLRGWQAIDDLVSPWNLLEGQVCRVLVYDIKYRMGQSAEDTDD